MAPQPTSERSPETTDRGFTLVEILLAVCLLAIIMTVMYSAFHTMGRVIRRTEQTKDTYQMARLILSRMRQELGCAYFSGKPGNFVFRGENIEGRDGDADALTFVTAGHIISGRDVAEGDFAEVCYYLDENNPGILVRREDTSPDGELEVGGSLDILGKNVVGLNFVYFDAREPSAQTAGGTTSELDEQLEEEKAWKDEWDPEESPYLPRAVRIDLALLNEAGNPEDFSTTVALVMGRTETSIQPPAQGLLAPPRTGTGNRRGGPPRDMRGPRPGGERPPRGGRGDRREFAPDRGGNRPGRDGSRGPTRSSYRPGSPGAPNIRGTSPNAGAGMRPPTPGGRR